MHDGQIKRWVLGFTMERQFRDWLKRQASLYLHDQAKRIDLDDFERTCHQLRYATVTITRAKTFGFGGVRQDMKIDRVFKTMTGTA